MPNLPEDAIVTVVAVELGRMANHHGWPNDLGSEQRVFLDLRSGEVVFHAWLWPHDQVTLV